MAAPSPSLWPRQQARRVLGQRAALPALAGACLLLLFVLWPAPSARPALLQPPADATDAAAAAGGTGAAPAAAADAAEPVQVQLFVMSQCPDARFCEDAFRPILERLGPVAALRTDYIAALNAEGTAVTCMHGARECDGNKAQLCLQRYVPPAQNGAWFVPALKCHMGGDVANTTHLAACMAEVGMPADLQAKAAACAAGSEGVDLQVKSAQEVKARGVVKSCTVFIAGAKRCVRDGGTWYDCPGGSAADDFVRAICDAHKAASGRPGRRRA
ncbi:hypothetical protein HT031_005763 [Scenedesmus sp. PABB004]|nr:hypothetical protein HT031_005763 [Scenedesmus sp. PABB004]